MGLYASFRKARCLFGLNDTLFTKPEGRIWVHMCSLFGWKDFVVSFIIVVMLVSLFEKNVGPLFPLSGPTSHLCQGKVWANERRRYIFNVSFHWLYLCSAMYKNITSGHLWAVKLRRKWLGGVSASDKSCYICYANFIGWQIAIHYKWSDG